MIRLILARTFGGIVVIFAVATFAFFMLKKAPGGPFDDERGLPPQVKANLEANYGLDKPLSYQYWRYITNLVPNGKNGYVPNLGYSIKRKEPVWKIIATHFPISVRLGVLALALATFMGIVLGVVAARRQNTWFDAGAMSFALFGISVPSFVLGPILILVFSLQLGWFAPAGIDGLGSLILPALTLGLIYMGVIARLSRSGMLETLRQDYIRTARAKGLPENKVVWKHALRLGLLPVVTYLGPATAALITGSFVVEKIFQIPGLGFFFIASISDRDYELLTGILVFYSVFLVVLNLLVDIAYGFLDPRIRDAR